MTVIKGVLVAEAGGNAQQWLGAWEMSEVLKNYIIIRLYIQYSITAVKYVIEFFRNRLERTKNGEFQYHIVSLTT